MTKNMKIIYYYLFASLLPAIMTILSGLIQMPHDCNQCIVLIIVGSLMVLLWLLVLNFFYFLLYIKTIDKSTKLFLTILGSLSPSIIYLTFIFLNYYDHSRQNNSDFKILLPSAITCIIIGIWTTYKNMESRRKS